MKKLICLLALLVIAVFAFSACETTINDGKIDGLDEIPVSVDVTGLEGVTGTATVTVVDNTQKTEALDLVKDAYYIPEGAETYAVDISITNNGEVVEVGKPVTVSIELPQAKLPLDRYVVFHIHDGKAEEIVPTVSDGKLTFTVESFSLFLVVPAHEHAYGEWRTGSEATCTQPKVEIRTCQCGAAETREAGEALGHEMTHHEMVVESCTEPGNIEYFTCSACGKIFLEAEGFTEITLQDTIVPPLDHVDRDLDGKCDVCGIEIHTGEHTHAFGEWTTEKEATCTESGKAARRCSCGEIESKELPALGHIDKDNNGICDRCKEKIGGTHEHQWSAWQVSKAATCTESGTESRKCSCGAVETREIAALGHIDKDNNGVCDRCKETIGGHEHTWSAWQVGNEATCTEPGKEFRKCSCGAVETRETPALGHIDEDKNGICDRCKENLSGEHQHQWSEWHSGADGTLPSCTASSMEIRTCACGEVETRVVPPLGHVDEDKDGICERCGQNISGEAHQHQWSTWRTSRDATCTRPGTETRSCSCGASESREIPALGHVDENRDGYCDRCRERMGTTHTHEYTWRVLKEATCTEPGMKVGTCTCGESIREEIPALDHKDENGDGKCDNCGETIGGGETPVIHLDDVPYIVDGTTVYFGSYPQTLVSDSTLASLLTKNAGALPTAANSQNWTGYGYYLNRSNETEFTWYIDLTYQGTKYRGVYFTDYRRESSTNNFNPTGQEYNGYLKSDMENVHVYWFRFEPIKWNIVTQDGNRALLICDLSIDCQSYNGLSFENYNTGSMVFEHNGEVGWCSNYKLSDIRNWLNNTFYETAFDSIQKQLIEVTTVDNSPRSTCPTVIPDFGFDPASNDHACEDTEDRLFLISLQDITNDAYGFKGFRDEDELRMKGTTDYARCQGISSDPLTVWWTRSPSGEKNYGGVYVVTTSGTPNNLYGVESVSAGVVPMLWIRFDEEPTSEAYTKDGNTIYFGKYPQTKVTDEDICVDLLSLAGDLPTESDSKNWTSYGYFIDGNVSDYMWYIDVPYMGETYRGVYFTQYRPYFTTLPSSINSTDQYINGYTPTNVYWFKFEPVKWRILSLEDGNALILCESIIDSQAFDCDVPHSNNYADSTIRAWLNDTFYNTAFSELQKGLIVKTTVDNSMASANPDIDPQHINEGVNNNFCEDTEDNVFLLSKKEVTTAAYGFDEDHTAYGATDINRRRMATDYALCQGGCVQNSGTYKGNGVWLLRSPIYYDSMGAMIVGDKGDAADGRMVYAIETGIVPALVIHID